MFILVIMDHGSDGRIAFTINSRITIPRNSYEWKQCFYIESPSMNSYITKDIKLLGPSPIEYEYKSEVFMEDDFNYLDADIVYDGVNMQGWVASSFDRDNTNVIATRHGLCPVTISNGIVSDWEYRSSDIVVDMNTTTCMVPKNAYIDIVPSVKYDMFFDHWVIEHIDTNGVSHTFTETRNDIQIPGIVRNGSAVDYYISSVNITAVHVSDSAYVTITFANSGYYIAYCNKTYRYISERIVYVERNSIIIVCQKPGKRYFLVC